MIAKLIWKEWREHRWKLALGCVVLMGFTLIALQARMVRDEIVVVSSLLLGGLVLLLVAPAAIANISSRPSCFFSSSSAKLRFF